MLIWSSMAHLSPHLFFSPYLFSLHCNIVSIIFNLQQYPHPANLTIHSIIFGPQTNQPSNFIFLFIQSCQGFHPQPASSWPPSEVPSSSSPVVWPCPFSIVLYQSTHWPVGHLSFIIGLMSNSTWPGGHCLLKSVCQLYIVLTFSSVFNVINFCPFGGYYSQ